MTGFEIASSDHLEIGPILNRSISTLKGNPVFFLGLAALVTVPGGILQALGLQSMPLFVNFFLGVLAQGAIAYGVFRGFHDQEASFGEALSHTLGRFAPLVIAALLLGLGIGLGLVLLVIPGVILACAGLVTIQACAVEGLGTMDSLKRSLELTKGHRLRIFALMFVAGLVFALGAVLAGVLIGLAAVLPGPIGYIAGPVVGLVFSGLWTAFLNILITIVYCDLRSIKEGLAIESLAHVFD